MFIQLHSQKNGIYYSDRIRTEILLIGDPPVQKAASHGTIIPNGVLVFSRKAVKKLLQCLDHDQV